MSGEQKSPSPDDETDENLCQVSAEPETENSVVVPGPTTRGGAQRAQELFGDPYLMAVMVVLLMLHLLQHGMRDPCTC
tara:strand:- start:767 stop:1000 length:234 start_codon:yes stop_codon:yes gene_type:complete